MSIDEGLLTWAEDALAPLGRLTFRRMMGGATLYLDGVIFAILDESELWFKADAVSDPVWDEVGSEKFTVTFADGKTDLMNYRRAPADVYDDAEAMQHWASLALEAGARRPVRRKPRKDGEAV